MNQGSGNFANDSSGFNNNGTLSGASIPTWATSLNNGSVNQSALSFGGTSSYVNISNSSLLPSDVLNFTYSTPYSVSFWVKFTDDTGIQALVSKIHTDSPNPGWELINVNNQLNWFVLRTSVANQIQVQTASNFFTNNTWNHILATYNGNSDASGASIYVNGVSVPLTVVSNAAGGEPRNNNYTRFGSRSGTQFFLNGTMDEVKIFNYALNQSEITTEFQRFQPTPAFPVANSVISASIPPITTSINFTWYDTVYPSDEIQVAEDSSFIIMDADQFTTSDFANIQLNSGKTYFWRVKQFNPSTGLFGNTSETQTFSIASASSVSVSSPSVQGIVFEVINGVQTPVSGAQVYLVNATSNFEFTTASNGFFLFQNLAANSTYSISATNAPVYNPTATFEVTTPTTNSAVTQNLLMTRFFSPFVPNYVYEKFIVRDIFDNKFSGVTVEVFEDGNVVPIFSKTTDSMGQATFQLIKDTYYRVEFSGGGLSSKITVYVYGKEEEYEVLVLSGVPNSNVTTEFVTVDLNMSTVNATYNNLTLSYTDASLTTSRVDFTVYNMTTGTSVIFCSQTFLSTNVINTGCNVPTSGNSYVWNYTAVNQFGTSSGAKTISFPVTVNTTLSSSVKNWIAIILLVILTSMFSKRNVKQGAIVVPLMAFILSLQPLGWLQVSPVITASALVLGVLYYMRKQEVQVQI